MKSNLGHAHWMEFQYHFAKIASFFAYFINLGPNSMLIEANYAVDL